MIIVSNYGSTGSDFFFFGTLFLTRPSTPNFSIKLSLISLQLPLWTMLCLAESASMGVQDIVLQLVLDSWLRSWVRRG